MTISRPLRLMLLMVIFVLLVSPSYLRVSEAIGKKLSQKDLEELEDQWFEDEPEDPEDLTRWKKGPNGERVPPKPKHKSEMAFVGLHKPIDKDETGKWGGQMADVLVSGGVDVRAYPVEAGKVLFVTDGGAKDMIKVQKFILKQEKVVDFEWNQKKYYPKLDDEPVNEEEDQLQADIAAGDIEAIMARARAKGAAEPSADSQDKKKHTQSLGGAGSPIPAEFADEL